MNRMFFLKKHHLNYATEEKKDEINFFYKKLTTIKGYILRKESTYLFRPTDYSTFVRN